MPSTDRRSTRIAGWLFLATFAFSIPGFLLYGPLLDHPDYVLGDGHDTRIAFGALLEILTAVCNIGTAVALYPATRRVSPRLALGYVGSRILESTIIVAGIVSVMSVVTLRRQVGADADPDALVLAGQTLVAFHDWTFLLGPGFCAGIGTGLLLGYLMYSSGLLPRRVAVLGLLGGTFATIAAIGALLGVYERQSAPQFLLTVPEMAWELTLGVVLIRRGLGGRERARHHAAAVAPVAA